MLSKSLEDAYRDFTMQHKFPFAVLHFHVNGEESISMFIRQKWNCGFRRQQEEVYNSQCLRELIQTAEVPSGCRSRKKEVQKAEDAGSGEKIRETSAPEEKAGRTG